MTDVSALKTHSECLVLSSCIHLTLNSLFFLFYFVLFVCLFSDDFFDPKYDRCFCTECHAARGDNLYYFRGKPAMDYGIPIGWFRFGLKLVELVISIYHKTLKRQSSGRVHIIAEHSTIHSYGFSVVFLDVIVGKFMLRKFCKGLPLSRNFVGVKNLFRLSQWQSSES